MRERENGRKFISEPAPAEIMFAFETGDSV
jgi:hypothetical protein